MIRSGKLDVPLIRLSWLDRALSGAGPDASRRVDPSDADATLALDAALDFHAAVDGGDANAITALSSAATVAAGHGDPAQVAAIWSTAVGEIMNRSTGVATGAYTLRPEFDALVFRVVYDAPAVPTVLEGPMALQLATLLPLVYEEEGWKADHALWLQQERLLGLLGLSGA